MMSARSWRKSQIYVYGMIGLILGLGMLIASLPIHWIELDIADGLGPERVLSIAAKIWSPILNALIMALVCGVIVQFLLKGKLMYIVGFGLVLLELSTIAIPVLTLISSSQKLISHSRQMHIFSDRYNIVHLSVLCLGPSITILAGVITLIGTLMIVKYPRSQLGGSENVERIVEGIIVKNDQQGNQHVLPNSTSHSYVNPLQSLAIPLDNITMWQAVDAGIDFTDTDSADSSTTHG